MNELSPDITITVYYVDKTDKWNAAAHLSYGPICFASHTLTRSTRSAAIIAITRWATYQDAPKAAIDESEAEIYEQEPHVQIRLFFEQTQIEQ